MQFPPLGSLNNLSWEVGVSLASSECERLHVPIIRLTFSTTENDKEKVTEMEMSFQEFQVRLSTLSIYFYAIFILNRAC